MHKGADRRFKLPASFIVVWVACQNIKYGFRFLVVGRTYTFTGSMVPRQPPS